MIKVLIADDQKTVQEIIKSYIEEDSCLELVGCANNGKEALGMIQENKPNIVLMDIEMPILDGISATKIISEKFVDTKVLIISVHNEDSYLNTALEVGAKGYLLKNTPEKELINAIYSAYKGYFQLGPGLLEKYLHKTAKAEFNTHELHQLRTIVMQQSEYIEDLSHSKRQVNNNSKNGRNHGSNKRNNFDIQYANLEKRIYHLSNRLDKQTKKIAFLQQFNLVGILGCGVMGVLLILFTL